MADEYLKLSHALLDNRAAQNRAADAMQLAGKALPCEVTALVAPNFVTVGFALINLPFTLPKVTIPVAMDEHVRLPITVGTRGVVRPADAQLGGLSGLGSGVPSLSQPANLGALVFEPISNTQWSMQPANTLVMYGEPNVLIMDKTGASQGFFTSSGITLSSGGSTLVINGSGITLDGILWDTHFHGGVTTGDGDTGGPQGP